MTREEFIKVLENKEYSYKVEEDKVVVTHKGGLDLNDLTSLPPNVVFKNVGYVSLISLTSIHPPAEFNNGGDVNLRYVTSVPPGVVFKNGKDVWLRSIFFGWWNGNIEGIDSKRLLNKMISSGLLDKERK
jgi:hypothetical protein